MASTQLIHPQKAPTTTDTSPTPMPERINQNDPDRAGTRLQDSGNPSGNPATLSIQNDRSGITRYEDMTQ
jgi:hypothetical protein